MRGRWVWLALGALLLVAAASALLVPLVRAATSGEPERTETAQGLACVQLSGDDYCQRIVEDLVARDPLSNIDEDTAGRFAERLRAAFEGELGAQCRAEIDTCVFAEPPTAERMRAALEAAGFSGPVVRKARLTDPAPLGATVYGVRAGGGCLVGWVHASAGSPIQAVGRLRDGTCLSP